VSLKPDKCQNDSILGRSSITSVTILDADVIGASCVLPLALGCHLEWSLDSLALAATQLGVGVQNLLSWLGLMSWGLCWLVVVKGEPDPSLITALEDAGFSLRRLPSNPYAAVAPPASAH
jgi:hypothetical protein